MAGTAMDAFGADGSGWFADPEEPRFRRLNAVTRAANVPLVGGILAFVAATLAAAYPG